MYEFTNSVSLPGSSRDTALHLGDEELRYESRQTTVQQNSSNLHKEVNNHFKATGFLNFFKLSQLITFYSEVFTITFYLFNTS